MKVSRSSLLFMVALLCVSLSRAFAMDLGFYRNLMQRGITDISHGNDIRGANELRIAAFGLIDELPLYQTTEVHLTLANDRLGRQPEARAGALKVLGAERTAPTYESLTLDAATRAAFEQLLPKLLTREQLASVPAFAGLAPSAKPSQSKPRFEPVPRGRNIAAEKVPERPQSEVVVAPSPTPAPQPLATASKQEPVPESKPLVSQAKPEPVVPPTPPVQTAIAPKHETPVPAPAAGTVGADPATSLASQAQASYLAGDYIRARELAEKAEETDDTNAIAHQVLGGLAVQKKNWADAVLHYSIVRTRQRLTDDESAWFLIGLVNTSRLDDAAGVRAMLLPRVLSRPDVQRALQTLDADRTKSTPPPVAATPPGPPTATPAAAKPQPIAIATPEHDSSPAVSAPPSSSPVDRLPAAPASKMAARPATQPSVSTHADVTKPAAQPAPAQARPDRIASSEPPASPSVAPTATRAVPTIDSPLVAAARHAPSESPLGGDVPSRIAEAARLLNEGKVLGARQIYLRLARYPDMPRNLTLDVAKGLNQTSSWKESSNAYEHAYPFARGEEIHMFYQAVNLYELGSRQEARDLFQRAAPALPNTREVALYRQKIAGK